VKEEDKREEATNKLTIVGGQAENKEPPVFKTNIEKVLLKRLKMKNLEILYSQIENPPLKIRSFL